jgi:hypothetical protein
MRPVPHDRESEEERRETPKRPFHDKAIPPIHKREPGRTVV